MDRYIVIDTSNSEFPTICTDEEGTPKIFESIGEANEEKNDCQEAIIVEI